MAANPRSPVETGSVLEQYHIYHAEAHILSGHLEHPIKQPVEDYGRVVLENTRRESLITQSVGETRVEGLISFKSGHTRVIGSQIKSKTDIFGNDHAGWVTLSSSAVEGLNVVDVSDLGIVLLLHVIWKTLGAGDAFVLTLDAIEKASVFEIWSVALGLIAANSEIEFHLDRESADPQIFEACAYERDLGNVAVDHRMLGRNLRHHAIGRHYINDIQPFDRRRGQSYPARVIVAEDIRLALDLAANDASVPRLKENQAFYSGLADRLRDETFAARIFQDSAAIIVDGLLNWVFEVAFE